MTPFFELALYSFWSFCGVAILLSLIGSVAVKLIVGIVAAARGSTVNFGDINRTEKMSPDDFGKMLREQIDGGRLDAPLSRWQGRNRARNGV